MTAVATCEAQAVAPPGVPQPFTPHRNVRVSDDDWLPFGDAVGARNRSFWLNRFIGMVNRDSQVWLDAERIAHKRGELLEAVVVNALRRYVARNRHLLDEDE